MKLQTAAVCGPGKVRTQNQDNLLVHGRIRRLRQRRFSASAQTPALLAIADGMGGEKHGELASRAAVEVFRKADVRTEKMLQDAILQANERICRLIERHGGERIGSTIAALLFLEDRAVSINLGDSRCYLIRDGRLRKLSRDHTVVQQMIDMEILTPEQARTHKNRHKLTQHLGIFPDEMLIEPYVTVERTQTGDLFLLCSDGLTDMVEEETILSVSRSEDSVEKKADSLFRLAMEAGGRDNITVILSAVL